MLIQNPKYTKNDLIICAFYRQGTRIEIIRMLDHDKNPKTEKFLAGNYFYFLSTTTVDGWGISLTYDDQTVAS